MRSYIFCGSCKIDTLVYTYRIKAFLRDEIRVTRNCGIVLAHIKSAQTLYSILAYTQGVQIGTIKRENLCVGVCIEYSLCQSRTGMVLEDVDIIAMPAITEVNDLLLFHCVMEICYHCMPVGSVNHGVYEYLLCFYDHQLMKQLRSPLLKKLFLCKLFTTLGLYPHEKKFHNSFFLQLASESIDNLWCRSVSMIKEQEIGDWLRACIAIHAHDKRLKTVRISDWLEIP